MGQRVGARWPQLAGLANDHLQLDSDELSSEELAALAMAGGAFDDLADENDLYSVSDGDEVGAD